MKPVLLDSGLVDRNDYERWLFKLLGELTEPNRAPMHVLLCSKTLNDILFSANPSARLTTEDLVGLRVLTERGVPILTSESVEPGWVVVVMAHDGKLAGVESRPLPDVDFGPLIRETPEAPR